MFVTSDGNTLKQWEQGRILTNEHMNKGDRVFFRGSGGEVHTMYATADGVEVPNALLQTARPMVVDLEGNASCRTMLQVEAADKPADYVHVDNTAHDNRISFNDLKDKPFYESTEVLFDQRVDFMDADGQMLFFGTLPELFEVGKTYRVTYNGVVYDCVAKSPGGDMGVLGNASAMGKDDTGEPFAIATTMDMGEVTLFVVSLDGSTSATVKIEGNVVHTIDRKFLPSGCAKLIYDLTTSTAFDEEGREVSMRKCCENAFNVVFRSGSLYYTTYKVEILPEQVRLYYLTGAGTEGNVSIDL